EQARMLAGLLRQRYPQAELVDAAGLDEAALRDRLRKSFLLVTLLNAESRLLPRVAEPLPFKFEGGVVRWDDFRGSGKDLRIDFIGRNPYGSGYSVVVAVGSLGMLQGGDDGQYSYMIRNSEATLRRGTYDQDFTATTHGRLKLADARGDVREFFATL